MCAHVVDGDDAFAEKWASNAFPRRASSYCFGGIPDAEGAAALGARSALALARAAAMAAFLGSMAGAAGLALEAVALCAAAALFAADVVLGAV